MSRARRARRQPSPGACPVTVTKPKLRMEAPTACASRSMTRVRSPARGDQGMRKAEDARADNGAVVALIHEETRSGGLTGSARDGARQSRPERVALRRQAARIRPAFRSSRIGRTQRAKRVASSSCR
jgi:hypothetical protein